MDDLGICCMSAMEMTDAVKTKRISPVEIVDALLHLIEKLNPIVNAFCTIDTESAKKQAIEAQNKVMRGERLGSLHGVPVSIKDLIFTKHIRTTGGSKIYENFIPKQNAIVVERLEAAGAIIIGKTNTCEFGWAAKTDNRIFGPTRNPWNLELTSGGSSGGAAASIALCMSPLAIGTDSGGSIRIPSSFCGVFGFKPSFGRVPNYPSFPGPKTLSHIGPITRTVEDAALAMEVIAGRDDRDCFSLPDKRLRYTPFLGKEIKGLRIAWSSDLGCAIVDPRVLKVTEAAVETFGVSGATIEVASPKAEIPEKAFSVYVGVGLATFLEDKLEEWATRLDPGLVRFVERSKSISAVEYARAYFELMDYWDKVRPFFETYDLLLTPTVAVPPFKLHSYAPRDTAGIKTKPLNWVAFTYPFNITGQPAASVPCGFTDDGLPVGLQIVGRRFDDRTVLRAAASFEQVLPWASRRPLLLNEI